MIANAYLISGGAIAISGQALYGLWNRARAHFSFGYNIASSFGDYNKLQNAIYIASISSLNLSVLIDNYLGIRGTTEDASNS